MFHVPIEKDCKRKSGIQPAAERESGDPCPWVSRGHQCIDRDGGFEHGAVRGRTSGYCTAVAERQSADPGSVVCGGGSGSPDHADGAAPCDLWADLCAGERSGLWTVFFDGTASVRKKLFYPKSFLKENQFGKMAIHYYTVGQQTRKWEVTSTYGGKMTENIVQAIARDCLAETLRRIDTRGLQVVSMYMMK